MQLLLYNDIKNFFKSSRTVKGGCGHPCMVNNLRELLLKRIDKIGLESSDSIHDNTDTNSVDKDTNGATSHVELMVSETRMTNQLQSRITNMSKMNIAIAMPHMWEERVAVVKQDETKEEKKQQPVKDLDHVEELISQKLDRGQSNGNFVQRLWNLKG